MESIGHKLRALREQKGLSQGDIERTTGMLRCYISQVENGHTVPAVENLERFARALGMPLYQLFLSSPVSGQKPVAPASQAEQANEQFLLLMKDCVHGLDRDQRVLLLSLAQHLAAK